MATFAIQTIDDKIVETLHSKRTKEARPPAPSLHSKLGCLLFSIGSSNSSTTLMKGKGEEMLYFSLLKSVKCQKAPLGQSALTDFVANCRLNTAFTDNINTPLFSLFLLTLMFLHLNLSLHLVFNSFVNVSSRAFKSISPSFITLLCNA